jgi:RND family efflux transporter MFP subunit
MMLFRQISFWLAMAGITGAVLLIKKTNKEKPRPAPLVEPARSPFADSVAATGIIEARQENVRIATTKAGLVTKVHVAVGQHVKSGEALFQLDDRDARAKLTTAESQLGSLRAALKAEQAMLADAVDQKERATKLREQNVASEEELARKQFQVENWKARVAKIEADIVASQAQVSAAKTELDILTIRAPRDGSMLQVNVRAGEYANVNPNEPLMVLGEVEKLQIRADVDEQNAWQVQTNQPAVAFLKGDTKNPLPIHFIRIEPYVVPKKSLTGDSAERVDTRVLQIIFEMDRPNVPLYVGQQVDVFIQREKIGGAPAAAKTSAP